MSGVSAAPGGLGLSGSRGSTSTERLVMVGLFMVMSCSWKSREVTVDGLNVVPTVVVAAERVSMSVMWLLSCVGWMAGWMGFGTEKRKRPPGRNPAAS